MQPHLIFQRWSRSWRSWIRSEQWAYSSASLPVKRSNIDEDKLLGCLGALCFLLVFFSVGNHILDFFGIALVAVQVGGAALTVLLMVWLTLDRSALIHPMLEANGVGAITRLMGFILACIAAQLTIIEIN